MLLKISTAILVGIVLILIVSSIQCIQAEGELLDGPNSRVLYEGYHCHKATLYSSVIVSYQVAEFRWATNTETDWYIYPSATECEAAAKARLRKVERLQLIEQGVSADDIVKMIGQEGR